MGFFKVIATCFRKSFQFKGVASRREFWFFVLFSIVLLCITLIIDGAYLGPLLGDENVMAFDADAGKWLSLICLILLLPALVSVSVRRVHDSNLSGWFLPIALCFAVLMFFVMHQLFKVVPFNIQNQIGQYIPMELFYLNGFIPLFYVLGKSGVKENNKFLEN